MSYNSREEPIKLTHVNTQLNQWIAIVNWSMKGQKWLISCMKKYRKNIVISSGIAIFSDVSKRCNILLSQYIAIKNAHPCCQLFQISKDRKIHWFAAMTVNSFSFEKMKSRSASGVAWDVFPIWTNIELLQKAKIYLFTSIQVENKQKIVLFDRILNVILTSNHSMITIWHWNY